MDEQLSSEEFVLLRDLIAELTGNLLAQGKSYLIESRLSDLLSEYGCRNFRELHTKARSPLGAVIREAMVERMTINETLWFRDTHPYAFMKLNLLPRFAQELREKKRHRVRIWSAACSSGQEAYSVAILLREILERNPGLRPDMFEIVGTDICQTVLSQARKGYYDRMVMERGMPVGLRDKYFKPEGRGWQIDDRIRQMVQFRHFNLMKEFGALGKFDLVLFRNVAIYFPKEVKTQIFNKLGTVLDPQGVLFLGASESLIAYVTGFKTEKYQSGVYYCLK